MSSTRARCRAPWRPRSTWHGHSTFPVQPDDELHELRPGEADGLTVDQWRERYWPRPPAVRDAFTPPTAPGGESWVAFLARAGAAIAALVDRHPGETVVAVCHGGVIEASFYLAFGLGGSADRVSFAVLNTSITRWRHRRGPEGRREWTAVTYNDAGHLASTDTPTESPREAVPTPPGEAGQAEHRQLMTAAVMPDDEERGTRQVHEARAELPAEQVERRRHDGHVNVDTQRVALDRLDDELSG